MRLEPGTAEPGSASASASEARDETPGGPARPAEPRAAQTSAAGRPVAPARRRLARLWWGVLAYNLAVIVWGAFVRASKSGAGCGDHWPLCHGRILPSLADVTTRIELTHRVTSGLAWVAVAAAGAVTLSLTRRGDPARRAATFAFVFVTTEALVGAAIVLLQYVALDPSAGRALWMALHLVNTFLLVYWLTLAAWWADGRPAFRWAEAGALGKAMLIALGAALLTALFGSQAALADTLFPARTLAEGLAQDITPGGHFVLKLRVLHPMVALGATVAMVIGATAASALRPVPAAIWGARAVYVLVAVQVALGFVNVALLAPVWMQLVHLLGADLLWIALTITTAAALGAPRSTAAADEGAAAREPAASPIGAGAE